VFVRQKHLHREEILTQFFGGVQPWLPGCGRQSTRLFAARLFGEIAEDIGLPKGVLNVITGGIDVAQLLTSHPDVDLISFTGSDHVGALIMRQAPQPFEHGFSLHAHGVR
jgi:hypothetical protein